MGTRRSLRGGGHQRYRAFVVRFPGEQNRLHGVTRRVRIRLLPGYIPGEIGEQSVSRALKKLTSATIGTPEPPLVKPRLDEYGLVNLFVSLFLFNFEGVARSAVASIGRDPVVKQAMKGIDDTAENDGVFQWCHPHNLRTDRDFERIEATLSISAVGVWRATFKSRRWPTSQSECNRVKLCLKSDSSNYQKFVLDFHVPIPIANGRYYLRWQKRSKHLIQEKQSLRILRDVLDWVNDDIKSRPKSQPN